MHLRSQKLEMKMFDNGSNPLTPRSGLHKRPEVRQIRRRLLGAVALSAVSAALPSCATRASEDLAEPVAWSSGRERPFLAVPPGSVDCHHHIFNAAYPNDPRATNVAPDALVPDYRRLQQRLRLSRHVVVQPSAYVTDNRCLVEALQQFGPLARGIAVVDASISDDELMALHMAGVRGLRFNLQFQVGAEPGTMVAMSRRIAPLGWHIQLNATADQFVQHRVEIMALESPIVFDHMAQLPQPQGIRHPTFAMMKELVQDGRAWVKLSGVYQTSKVGPPTYSDSSEVAKALINIAQNDWYGAPIGPIHPSHSIANRTMRCFSISSPSGRRMRSHATTSSCRTRSGCMGSRPLMSLDPLNANGTTLCHLTSLMVRSSG